MRKGPVLAALIAMMITAPGLVACGATAKSDEPDTPIQKRMKSCITGAVNRTAPPKPLYEDCLAGYEYMKTVKPADSNHGDTTITAAILEIYAGGLAYELGRRDEAIARVRDGKDLLVYVSEHSDDADVRHRAKTMKACLIDRDPVCLKNWEKAASAAGSQ